MPPNRPRAQTIAQMPMISPRYHPRRRSGSGNARTASATNKPITSGNRKAFSTWAAMLMLNATDAGAVKLAGPALYGAYGVADYAVDASAASREFAKLYAAVSNVPPDNYSSWTYDAIGVLAMAINKAGSTDPDKIRAAMLSTKGYQGAEGEYNFDEFGDGLHGYNIVRNEKGVIVFDKHIEFTD